ncbi:MAG: hypothetical protein HN509_05855 [Halobacteriovoraceae bacterium]|nr:hypothetical protein [Halobacteriovoraceae bacterium]MBT5094534.1 hypothetical protein [Halobacteriovoraceae bacterium]
MRKAFIGPIIGLAMTLMFTQVAVAGVHILLKVTNDIDREVYDLAVVTNEDDHAVGLKLIDRNKSDHYFDVSDLKGGVVLKKEGSRKVIVLRSSDFEKDRGGHFKLDFLSNGITGSRDNLDLKCQFGKEKWQVFYKGRLVSKMFFVGKTVFGKLVGIKQVIIK